MEDWGEIKLTQIGSDDFWCLYDEMVNDKCDFIANRSIILEAYKQGNLYGLTVSETDKNDSIFCQDSFYLLPCFCVKENNTAVIIWTHTRARKMGFAKKLVELLNIEYADNPLPSSIEFWKKCGVKLINVKYK